MTADVEPAWASDLVVHRGGRKANEILVLDATERRYFKVLNRLATAWTGSQGDDLRAWVAYALTQDALSAVGDYFDRHGREDSTHGELAAWLDARLPIQTCSVTQVSVVEDDRPDVLVRLEADPPNQGGLLACRIVEYFNAKGFHCEERITEEILFTRVEYATGDVGYEQVLGWDDIYTDDQLNFLSEAERLFVRLHPTVADLDAEEFERLAGVIPSARREPADLPYFAPDTVAGADGDQGAEHDEALFDALSVSGRRLLGQARLDFDRDLLDELDGIETDGTPTAPRPTVDPWLDAGLVPADVPAWQAVMQKVAPAQVWNPDRAVGADESMYLDANLLEEGNARTAARWQAAGFTPAEANDWSDALGIHDDWRLGPDAAARWRSRGFTPADAGLWVCGDVAPGVNADDARIFRDAGWHPFHVWTLHCLLEQGPALEASTDWASLPITHALNCARAGLNPREAASLLGCDKAETEYYLSRRFDERGRIDPFRAMLFNHYQYMAHGADPEDSVREFFARHLWDLHDETDDEDRRRGKEPTYGGPHTVKPRWKFLEERLEREKREAERLTPELCPGTGGSGILEFRDGLEEWYVTCRICGTCWMGGSATNLSPHNMR